MKRRLPGLSYANVMATIAVFVVLGGVSYAANVPSRSWDGTTYRVFKDVGNNSPFDNSADNVFCDLGDPAIGGGTTGPVPEVGTLLRSFPAKTASNDPSDRTEGWSIFWHNAQPNIPARFQVIVRCADFPP